MNVFDKKRANVFFTFLAWIQLISIPISYFSLAWQATWAYLQQRVSDYSDPDPPKNIHFFLVFFLFFVFSFSFVAAWSLILAYMKWMVLVIVILALMVNFLICFPVCCYFSKSWIKKEEFFKGPFNKLMFKSIVSSLMVPSVAIHHKVPILFFSTLSTTINLIVTLSLITLIVYEDNGLSANFPLFSCFKTDNETLAGNICLIGENEQVVDCGQTYWRVCSKNCLNSVRFCGEGEKTFQMLKTVRSAVICALCGCILLSVVLQWMSNYLNVYKYTKHLFHKAYIHRSILFLAIEENDIDLLESVLAEKNVDKNMINRRNRQGQTPLVLAISKKDPNMVKLLIWKTYDISLFRMVESSPPQLAEKVCN